MVAHSHRFARSVVFSALVLLSALSGCADNDEADSIEGGLPKRAPAAAAAPPLRTFLCGDEQGAPPFAGYSPDAFVDAFEERYGIRPSAPNEERDCQRLILPAAPRDTFGPLVTLWVDQNLPGPGGYINETLVAVITADAAAPSHGLPGTNNCFYLKQNGSRSWSAWVSPIADRGQCPETLPPDAETINVTPLPAAIPGLPASGRIHEGPNYTYFFGIQCLPDLWCALGKDMVHPGYAISAHARGDKQRLSFKSGNQLVASNLKASISPEPYLATFKRAWFERPRGVKVATIVIDGIGTDEEAETAYVRKWQITESSLPRRVNVYLRRDAAVTDTTRGWTLRYTDTGTEFSKDQIVATHAGPGAARWRWSQDDEGVWIQCLKGCCSDW